MNQPKYYAPEMLAVVAGDKEVINGLVNDGEIDAGSAVCAKFRRATAKLLTGDPVTARYVKLQSEMDAIAAEKGVKL